MTKQPCFMCGKESTGWIVSDGKKRRVCPDCAVALGEALYNQGADVVVMNKPEDGQATVFEHGRDSSKSS